MKRLILVIGLAVCLMIAACTPSPEETLDGTIDPAAQAPLPSATFSPNIPSSTRSPSATADIPKPDFETSDCPFEIPYNMSVRCGYVSVPEMHDKPGGDRIRLAVAVVKDFSATHQPDPVILLTGGPGEKTIHNGGDIATLLAHTHPDRDLILFDQRGVGLSEPALDCPGWVDAQYDVLDESDQYIVMQQPFDALVECRDELVERGVNLSAYNTTQSAADVNAIRQALGYEQLNLLGGSYGSFLAQAVAQDFPEIVRSMVINSVWPLEQSFTVNSPVITFKAVEKFLDACAADPACDQAYPDLENVLFAVVDRLNDNPIEITTTHILTGQSFDVLLTGDRVYSSLISHLYYMSLIPRLPQAIYDVYNGDYELITQLQGTSLAMYDLMSRGMTYSVVCREDLIGMGPEDVAAAYDQLPDMLWEGIDEQFAFDHGIFGVCKLWDVPEADPSFKQPLTGDLPALLLEGEFDPVTPVSYAEMVEAHLSNSSLFVFPGVGHDVLSSTTCARRLIGAFIQDPAEQLDSSCITGYETGFLVPYEDPRGYYSIPLPSGWTVEERDGMSWFSNPEGTMTASVFTFEGENYSLASDAAWKLIDPTFDGKPNLRETDCVGCAAGDSQSGADFALLNYQTGDPDRTAVAAAWIHEGLTYLMIWQADPNIIEANSTLVNTLIMGFEIDALD